MFFKKNKKRGVGKNPHGLQGGVTQKSTLIHMGGGGQKYPKNDPHGL